MLINCPYGVPLWTVSLHTGHGLQSVNGSISSHKTLLFMGFSANSAGKPNTVLETQKAGYFSKHKSNSRIRKGVHIHMSSLLSVVWNSDYFFVILR